MSGSSPEALVVTASAGTGLAGLPPSAATDALTRSISFWEVGPRFEPDELAAL